MPFPVAAEPPSPDSPRDDAPVRRRQPPGDLGRAYRIAFVETGALEVVLPATEPVPVQRPSHRAATAAARDRLRTAPRVTGTTGTAPRPTVPEQRSAPPTAAHRSFLTAAPATTPAAGSGQLARRSRALVLGLALGVVLGALAVVLAGLAVSWLGLLPR